MAVLNIIEYEGNNNILIHRAEQTDFNTLSQLVVRESQRAILFKEGQMLDTLGPGRHTMHTGNIPLLSKLINLPFGGETPFQCEVYFVNQALSLNRLWGTSSPTKVFDNTTGLYLDIGARGVMGIKVEDPRKLLMSVVGTESDLGADQCLEYFAANISAKVGDYIGQIMSRPGVGFITLDQNRTEYSKSIKNWLSDDLSDVGVSIYNFIIEAFNIPREQYSILYRGQMNTVQAQYDAKELDIRTDAEVRNEAKRAELAAYSRRAQGYNWADEKKAEIAMKYADSGALQSNPANMLAGIAPAMAMGNYVSRNLESVMQPEFSNQGMNFGQPNSAAGQSNAIPGGPDLQVMPVIHFDDGVMPDSVTPIVVMGNQDSNVIPANKAATDSQIYSQTAPVQGSSNPQQTQAVNDDPMARLREVIEMKKQGLLDDDEFKAAKKNILGL